MIRTCLFSALFCLSLALGSCGRSGLVSLDSGSITPSDRGAADGMTPPRTCKGLRLAGMASLGDPNTSKMQPRVVFDGDQFAVVWHSQPVQISSLSGDLRFARVSPAGKASAISNLGWDNGAMPHALAATSGEVALVHLPKQSGGLPALERRLISVDGATKKSSPIPGSYGRVALAPAPAGHAAVLAPNGGSPSLMLVDRSGNISHGASMITAQVMASIWLGIVPGGYAVLLHSTNSNAELHLFDSGFKAQGIGSLGQGALIRAPSMTAIPGGYAAIYNTSWSRLYTEVLDAGGKSAGRKELSSAPWASGITGLTAMIWTGDALVATYPSSTSGRFVVRPLNPAGVPLASATSLPNCVGSAAEISAAWGKNRLAVAAINRAPGSMQSKVCVTVMECF